MYIYRYLSWQPCPSFNSFDHNLSITWSCKPTFVNVPFQASLMSFWPSSAAFLFVRAGHRMYRTHAPETGSFLNGSSASDGFRFIPKATCLGDGGTMSCVAPNTVATTRSWRYGRFLQSQCRSCGNRRTMTPTGTGGLGRKTWLTGSTRKTTRTSTWALAVFLGASQCDNAKTIRTQEWHESVRFDVTGRSQFQSLFKQSIVLPNE